MYVYAVICTYVTYYSTYEVSFFLKTLFLSSIIKVQISIYIETP